MDSIADTPMSRPRLRDRTVARAVFVPAGLAVLGGLLVGFVIAALTG
jgi:hypothetical protein